MQSQAKFHGHYDSELQLVARQNGEPTTTTKHLIVQERDVSYRFFPHFHPYVGQLVAELLRNGTPGLQAADTLYDPDGRSLPAGVDVAMPGGATVSVPAGARIAMLTDTQADLPGGVIIGLSAHMQLKLAAAVQATATQGMTATLIDSLPSTPAPGSDLGTADDKRAYIAGDVTITLPAGAAVVLHDGSSATLKGVTRVVLATGSTITIPKATKKTVAASRRRPQLYGDVLTDEKYRPSALVSRPYPVRDLDFTASGAYSIYNWELFFHVPFTMAVHLSKNQRFAEAQRWFHYVFDPTDDSDGPTPERFWKVRPFQQTEVKKVEELLVNLATNTDPALREETIRSIDAWKDAPFRPHVIARYRQQAYMYKTVMAYLDNLIAWGDSLFRQDTGEAIDEALMLYVLAASILGPRPQTVPKKGSVRPQTYANLRKDLQQFGTVLRDLEADIGYDLMPFPADNAVDTDRLGTVRSLGRALYFGVPGNDRLMAYWDTVADRLFKIRNSLNLEGTFRQLPLFEPPIDPGMLARATAAGLDVGAIVNGLNQPLPLVRFPFLVAKAAEICQEVRALGANLLSIIEKEDAEALALLRSKHERVIMRMTEDVKYAQLQEATKSREGLLKSLGLAVQRYAFYERQLGKKPEEIEKAVPALEDLDKDSLKDGKFKMDEPEVAPRDIDVDIDTDLFGQVAQALTGGKLLSSHEVRETLFLESAQLSSDISSILSAIGSFVAIVPQFEVSAEPWGIGGGTQFGGQNIAQIFHGMSTASRGIADRLNFEARRAARIDGFARREREWAHQSNLAAGEITQIFKQLRAAQLREAIAEMELESHRQQSKHLEAIEQFLNENGTEKTGKTSNKALYTWLRREVKGLYAQCFQFAFDIAKKAERALQHELGNPELSYLQFGYLAGKEGLLAGERLYLDIKRMEMAYHDLNQREYELTAHISLSELDPLALVELRRTGRCTVRLPEAQFDMHGPGHYFRRIKSMAVTVPCVTGPYVSVNCTLSLLKSSVRTSPVLRDGVYQRAAAEDERFSDYLGSIQSIVTSSAQNDNGLFEANPRDERYLPFENAGAISEWQLELPTDPTKDDPLLFDYETIGDVVLHMRYTARDGGSLLRRQAINQVKALMDAATAPGSVRFFSVRHDFADQWARFQGAKPAQGERFELTIPLGPEHFPFASRDRLDRVERVQLLARSSQPTVPGTLDVFDKLKQSDAAAQDTLVKEQALGDLLVGELSHIALPARPVQDVQLYFETNSLADLWIAVTWAGKEPGS